MNAMRPSSTRWLDGIGVWVIGWLLAGCAPSPSPLLSQDRSLPKPAQSATGAPMTMASPRASSAGSLVVPAASALASTSSAPIEPIAVLISSQPAASAGSASQPPEPVPALPIRWETPYKYGERATPKDKASYLADIRDRRRWNDGGVGSLSAPLPAPEGHPDPRVIINVDKVRGGHLAKDLQRLARRNYWIWVVRCYRLGAYLDQGMQGWTKVRMEVRADGSVKSARLLSTELPQQASAACMADKLNKLSFARAASGSSAWLSLRVGPGDDPQPPPAELVEAGKGTLSASAIEHSLRQGLPALEQCYRAALEYAPELWGRIVLRLHITKRGKVDESFQTESRFPEPRMLQCVTRAAAKWHFERPRGGDLRLEIPIRFGSATAIATP